MEEYLDTQEQSAEQEGVVGSQTDEQDTQEQEGEKGQQGAGAAAQEENERDSRMAAARRSGSREGYRKARKEADEKIAAFGRTDPRTGKAIRSMEDVLSFLQGQEEADIEAEAARSKRPPEEIRREREAKRIGEEQLRRQQTEQDEARSIQEEYDDFVEEHGAELAKKVFAKGSRFYRFAGKRLGKEPLPEIYEDYLEFTGEVETAAAARKESKAQRGTGSGSGSAGDGLSSRERAALAEWNRNYPQYKMTEEEWKKR